MIVLEDDGCEMLGLRRTEDGDGYGPTITIFRYAWATDEVTAQFYLTEEELAVFISHCAQD